METGRLDTSEGISGSGERRQMHKDAEADKLRKLPRLSTLHAVHIIRENLDMTISEISRTILTIAIWRP
jgi:hypothetical protein